MGGMRRCPACGTLLTQKPSESDYNFQRRRFCNYECVSFARATEPRRWLTRNADIVWEAHLEGYGPAAIARQLEIPTQTVKNFLKGV